MGYALSVFLVPSSDILRVPGIPDTDLLDRLLIDVMPDLVSLDEQLCDAGDEDDITHEQAFRELFSGNVSAPEYGARYGWAFEKLCQSIGTYLPNNCFSPCKFEWYDQLDRFLATTDIELRFSQLVYNCPVEIPEPDDFPSIGHWTHEQIAAAAPMITKVADSAQDETIGEALSVVSEWLKQGVEDSNSMIIGFHG